MERVLRVGGYFLRAADPVALGAWYRGCLGLDADEHGVWRQEPGVMVFATFESETDYFGSRAQQTMLNFRVRSALRSTWPVMPMRVKGRRGRVRRAHPAWMARGRVALQVWPIKGEGPAA